jgi:hypothetical protein
MLRDYYWRRDGLRWIVCCRHWPRVTVESDNAGWGPESILFKAWSEKTAANVCNICFESYLEGRRVQRAAALR